MSGEMRVGRGVGKAYRVWNSEWMRAASWFGCPCAERGALGPARCLVHHRARRGVGVMGRNGAARAPAQAHYRHPPASEGRVTRTGRVAAILELGMGFNPDLSGRQNAFHSAGLMGYSQEQIEEAMPAIEAFAEIGEYFDETVRTYSSGMQVRVAFAVATAFTPDLLIVDEALSVGDSYFSTRALTVCDGSGKKERRSCSSRTACPTSRPVRSRDSAREGQGHPRRYAGRGRRLLQRAGRQEGEREPVGRPASYQARLGRDPERQW